MDDLFNFESLHSLSLDAAALGSNRSTSGAASPPSSVPRQQSQHSNSDNGFDPEQKKESGKAAFKVCIVGDPQVGKTSFLTKHLDGSFDAKYRATVGASTFSLTFNTNLEPYTFDVRDVAGQNLFAGKRDEYYQGIDAAIIMYDVMNWASYDNVTDVWLPELRQKAPANIPIVIVGNKMENRENRAVSVEVVAEAIQKRFALDAGIGYCEVSVKTNQNLAEPFLFITRNVLDIHSSNALYFVSKISESNLIESMLQHKKTKEDKLSANGTTQPPPPQNLDHLFTATQSAKGNGDGDGSSAKIKGSDYLDDVIFNIGDGDATRPDAESKNETPRRVEDHAFFGDMATSTTSSKAAAHRASATVPRTAKANASAPRTARAQSVKSVGSTMGNKLRTMVSPGTGAQSKNRKKTQSKAQPKAQSKPQGQPNHEQETASGVIVELLLGIQASLNSLKTDVRRLQNDVTFLKQQQQRQQKR